MNHQPNDTDSSWKNDAVWKLLDQAPPASPGPRFVDDTVRAARLLGQPSPWWRKLFSPLPLAGLAGATAALVFTTHGLLSPVDQAPASIASTDSAHAALIQEVAETETLIAAADHLEDFSDTELVTLIGF